VVSEGTAFKDTTNVEWTPLLAPVSLCDVLDSASVASANDLRNGLPTVERGTRQKEEE